MRKIIQFIIVLGLICLFMGSGVAGLYTALKPRIDAKERKQFEQTLQQVLPEETDSFEEIGDTGVYVATDAEGDRVGYAARGGAQGYSSEVRVLVGTRADATLTIYRVRVLSQMETPGLGANVGQTTSEWTLWEKIGHTVGGDDAVEKRTNPFLSTFRQKTVDELGDIDAMTAATITSNATKQAVREAVGRIRSAIER